MLTLGSLFDGIGGWQLAAIHAGVKPIWSSEIEKFPCAVTKHHFPETIQLGDITKIKAEDIPPVDIICAGSPCQDLSLAGKREGLKGERSGLFTTAVDIVRRLRLSTGGRQPRFFVWENVCGAFSSNSGMDFRCVLETIGGEELPMPYDNQWASAGMVRLQKCEIAWRVLDAQYWGVPQRRKRIFLVADFGEKPCAGKILFNATGLLRDSAEGGKPGEGFSERIKESVGDAGKSIHGNDSEKEKYSIVRMRGGCAGGGKGPLVSENKALTLAANTNDQILFITKPIILNDQGGKIMNVETDVIGTLRAESHGHAPIVCTYSSSKNSYHTKFIKEKASTLVATDWKDAPTVVNIKNEKPVRRLTPRECERLQGLPDDYTLIDDNSCSDSARYKALGNGMAQPCADYVIKRIVEVTA